MTEPARGPVKPRPVRIDDALYDQLSVVASLDGKSVTAAITTAIEEYVERKRGDGDLAGRAAEALAEIEREAAARRSAIESLVGPAKSGSAAGRSSSGSRREPPQVVAEDKPRRPVGFTARWV